MSTYTSLWTNTSTCPHSPPLSSVLPIGSSLEPLCLGVLACYVHQWWGHAWVSLLEVEDFEEASLGCSFLKQINLKARMPKSKLLSPCRVVDSQAINKYKVTTWMVIKSSQTALALEASRVRRENLTIPRRQEFHRSASAKGVHVTKSQTVTFWLRGTCVHRGSPGKVPIKQMYLSPNAPITKDIRLWKEHDWESMVQMQPNPVSWFRLDSNTICTGDYSCSSLSLKTLCIPFSKICFYWCVCVYMSMWAWATAKGQKRASDWP